ncbi:uncharacterized protein LOC117111602 [Anneissia japonica]|uniref:uncharacterized protein LOC117111602 n=1 Tax=Anneissia japonica TaxID=1529436 RepID=UPI001425531A|nr:uncharacterized protein LOC117111602 [Anneissia japonica]
MLRIAIILAVAFALTSEPRGSDALIQCPLLWTIFQNHCYRLFYSGSSLSQVEAEAECNEFSSTSGSIAHLPSASTPAEYNFLQVWLDGIIDRLDSNPVIIGLYSDWMNMYFGYDFEKLNPDYYYMPTGTGSLTHYVLKHQRIEKGGKQHNYVCKMHTTTNTNFNGQYFETEEPEMDPTPPPPTTPPPNTSLAPSQ